ncbi:MAG: disulfide bond formation protein B [Burkholderiales bacterium]
MNSAALSLSNSPLLTPARVALALCTVCASLVGGSFFVQHVLMVEPCPLCMIQRYTYLTLALLFLGIAALGARPRAQRALWFVALALVLMGGGVAAYQSKLQIFPAAQAATCSASLSYMMDTLPVADVLTKIFEAKGDCSDTSFTILGLTLAQISLVIFSGMALVLFGVVRRRRAR